MNSIYTLLLLSISTIAGAQLNCDSLITANDTSVCSSGTIYITANAADAGFSNEGECNYLPPLDQYLTHFPYIEPALRAWYPFCGNANDESLYGSFDHGTMVNPVIATDRFGRLGAAFEFDYVEDVLSEFGSTRFTFSAWIKTASTGEDQYIFNMQSDPTPEPWDDEPEFSIFLDYDPALDISFLRVTNNDNWFMTGWSSLPNTIDLADDQWHFISVSRSDGMIILYIDADSISAETPTYWNQPTDHFGYFGIRAFGLPSLSQFGGIIDDITYYSDDALFESELDSLFNIQPILTYTWSTGDVVTNTIGISPVQDTEVYVTVSDGTNMCTDTFHISVPGSLLMADTIYGSSIECAAPRGGKKSFYVTPKTGALNYQWTVPQGMTIASGQGSPTINVRYTTAAIYNGIVGVICVKIESGCGFGPEYCKLVDMQMTTPGAPTAIYTHDLFRMCPGDTSFYYINEKPRASSYHWTVPAGLHILEEQPAAAITVAADSMFTGGDIAVSAVNVCGSSTYKTKTIAYNTPIKPVISGPSNDFCHHSTGHHTVHFSVANAGAFSPQTLFYWSGVDQVFPPDNDPAPVIEVDWNEGTSGHTVVVAHNTCGVSIPGIRGWNTRPPKPGPINGPLLVCPGDTITYIASDSHLDDLPYWDGDEGIWSFIANGVEISGVIVIDSSDEERITVIWPANTPANASVRVRELNFCGEVSPWSVLSGIHVDSAHCGLRIADVESETLVYPNPVTDWLNLRITSHGSTAVDIRVLDVAGREMIRKDVSLSSGMNEIRLECTGLLPGSYLLQITDDMGMINHKRFQRK